MPPARLSLDTPRDIEDMLVDGWARMSPADKAAAVTGLTQAVYDLARAGIRLRHPDASPREQYLRLALLVLGPDLAREAYPDIDAMHLR